MPIDDISFEGYLGLFNNLIALPSQWQKIELLALCASYICIFFSLALSLYFHMVKPNALPVIQYL